MTFSTDEPSLKFFPNHYLIDLCCGNVNIFNVAKIDVKSWVLDERFQKVSRPYCKTLYILKEEEEHIFLPIIITCLSLLYHNIIKKYKLNGTNKQYISK